MAHTQEYDAIVIGSGQGGNPLALAFAGSGKKTALVERIHVGGTCINEGCTPTKTMVASADTAEVVRRAAEYGVHTEQPKVSLREVIARKRAIVDSFRASGERRLHDGDVDLIRGEASFTGPYTLKVDAAGGEALHLTAPLIVINTGGRPSELPLPGLQDVPHLNSTTIMDLDELPSHLLVLGGSYVGLEFGQMFRRFGSEVTVIQKGPYLMGPEDHDVADEVANILRDDGITIVLNAATKSVRQAEDGTILLDVDTERGAEALSGSHLLVAVGRTPNTDVLNPGAAGVETYGPGFVKVNERLETNVPGIYAIGDVKGGPAFTHISYDDYRIMCSNLMQGGHRTTADRLIPYVMFIDPQLGRVGLTEQQAREQGRNLLVAKMPMSDVARAVEVGETRGLVKAVVDADSGEILGCAVLGIEGGEIMAMIEIAMLGKLHYRKLARAIFAHPTLAELLNSLFSQIQPTPDPMEQRMMVSAV